MLADSYGNAISTSSQAARDHYDRGLKLFLGGEYGALEAFRAAVNADPDFALGHAACARAAMMSAQIVEAKSANQRAQELVRNADTRERRHIDCIGLVLSGQAPRARAAVLAHVQTHPRDALAAQLCANVFGLIGFSGEVGREAELLAYTSSLLPHYGEDWWMMSMHALSLCETGQVEASRDLMENSLALNPRNANAAHFKAHAQYEAGETIAGRAYLTGWLADYDDRSMLHGHLQWHVALWALHQGDANAMWQAVDTGIAPGGAKGLPINVLTDTAAILYRAELAGLPVDPGRWLTLSDYAAQMFPQTGQSFADLHAALSHAMAGQGDRLAHIADSATGFAGDLVKPLARAWGAIARENWAGALNELIAVMPATERVGGSRAQRDLLELTYANVLLKLGLADEARRSLAIRRPILAGAPPLAGLT
ncbi:tetratricopeptide repeat protein [Sedimentitalea todarodis]|uniref:Tetratricopeptide repeat protein 38 n=1 Tax=Sedimentitalea todarodis TaxID=1631240 RepID=A0ABU3V9V2_9RHOB|nr:tetratricopeptide repeat protein [Sedimentitalea todarodis]MDU9002927.1 tetratricopeptide repeat protein [Sedimentitalea todarodis]